MIQTLKNLNLLAEDKYNKNNSIKFETENIKSSLYNYSDTFVLVTGDITVNTEHNTVGALKNYAPFSKCKTQINDSFIDAANRIYIVMPMFNLIEYG